MTGDLRFVLGTASETDVATHLDECDSQYVPLLSSRTDIKAYARKIAQHATTFEAWCGSELVGLVAAYLDGGVDRSGFITNVSVLDAHRGAGIAATLLSMCVKRGREAGLQSISLDVSNRNDAALNLYRKLGFKCPRRDTDTIRMRLNLTETQA